MRRPLYPLLVVITYTRRRKVLNTSSQTSNYPPSSCNDAPSLFHYLSPFPPHALLQREVEDILHVVACLCRTLDVFCTDLPSDDRSLLTGDRNLALSAEHPPRLLVPAEVRLGRDQDERHTFTKVRDFGEPLYGSCR